MFGSSKFIGCAKNKRAMPVKIKMPKKEKALRARVVFCSRLRKLMERRDSCRARMPIT